MTGVSIPTVPPTSQAIRLEIEDCFGFFPPFFEPALATPTVLLSLWQQTQWAYLHNPLPALFKEKLAALLAMPAASSTISPLVELKKYFIGILSRPR